MNFLTIGCLLLGFILGESGLGLIDRYTIGQLKPFIALALGWVGFILGENLEIGLLRKISPRLLSLTLGQLLTSFLFTSGGMWFFLTAAAGWESGPAVTFSILAGTMATATDPITTMAFLNRIGPEVKRKTILAQTATIADVFTAVLFWGVFSFSVARLGPGSGEHGSFLLTLLLNIGLGLILGIALSVIIHPDRDRREVSVILLGAVTLAGGAAFVVDVSPLIICLFAGAFVMTVSPVKSLINEQFHQLEKPIYAAFLILCGALFQPALLLVPMALPALFIYVTARAAGKIAGVSAVAYAQKMEKGTGILGLGLLSQAGLAVVLAVNIYLEIDVKTGLSLVALTTAGIIINQVLGWAGMKMLGKNLTRGRGDTRTRE